MAGIHVQVPSFNAGELTPLLNSRFGVEKVGSGCRKLRNFYLHPHGPVFRRPGMEFLGYNGGAEFRSSLRGFNFSTTTGAVLEFHPGGLRVWVEGALVEQKSGSDWPYSEAEGMEVQLAQVNDVVYLAHAAHPPRRLVRYADDDWRLEEVDWKWPAMGDENVRSAEEAAPTVVTLFSRPLHTWPEAQGVGVYTVSLVHGVGATPANGVVKFFKKNTSGWGTLTSWALKAGHAWPATQVKSAPEPLTFRITYSGSLQPAGTKARIAWPGGSLELPLDVAQPSLEKPQTVPAGHWRVVVTTPAGAPAGARVRVEQLAGATWKKLTEITPVIGSVPWRGPKLAAAAQVRVRWLGDRAVAGGTVEVEELQFVPEVLLAVNNRALGTGRTMTATTAIFLPAHVGSYWQLSHRRDVSRLELVATLSSGSFGAETTGSLEVSGKWDLTTYGAWATTLFLEQEVGAGWEVVRSWTANQERNIVASGEVENGTVLRLRIAAGTGKAVSGAADPRFVLEAAEARVDGLVQVTAVGAPVQDGKAATATVTVVKGLASTEATHWWTEGAWSGARG